MTTHHSLVIDNEGLFSLLTNLFNCLFFSKGKFEKIKPATRGEEGRGHCEKRVPTPSNANPQTNHLADFQNYPCCCLQRSPPL